MMGFKLMAAVSITISGVIILVLSLVAALLIKKLSRVDSRLIPVPALIMLLFVLSVHWLSPLSLLRLVVTFIAILSMDKLDKYCNSKEESA